MCECTQSFQSKLMPESRLIYSIYVFSLLPVETGTTQSSKQIVYFVTEYLPGKFLTVFYCTILLVKHLSVSHDLVR